MEQCETRNGVTICPLNDEEVKAKMKYFENLICELEWRRSRNYKTDNEEETAKVYKEARKEIKTIASNYSRMERLIVKDTYMFECRMAGAARLKLLQEKDRNVTDVVLAVHRRLGRIDHAAHKKAYRRILYALVVQGLCRLLEKEVILVFRESDMTLGESVIKRAQEKYKEITDIEVAVTASRTKFLPIESCGGVDVCSPDRRLVVNNSLSFRLDQLLHKAFPMIRIALYGINKNRYFYDLSTMCGSTFLFDFPHNIESSEDQASSTETEDEMDRDAILNKTLNRPMTPSHLDITGHVTSFALTA